MDKFCQGVGRWLKVAGDDKAEILKHSMQSRPLTPKSIPFIQERRQTEKHNGTMLWNFRQKKKNQKNKQPQKVWNCSFNADALKYCADQNDF
eukprot:5061614-Amphidinium_carterae.1